MVFVFLFLISSPSMIISHCIHVAANDIISFLWLSNIPLFLRQETMGSIAGSGRSPGEENGNPLQYSCRENPVDREAWRATVHGVTKSWI